MPTTITEHDVHSVTLSVRVSPETAAQFAALRAELHLPARYVAERAIRELAERITPKETVMTAEYEVPNSAVRHRVSMDALTDEAAIAAVKGLTASGMRWPGNAAGYEVLSCAVEPVPDTCKTTISGRRLAGWLVVRSIGIPDALGRTGDEHETRVPVYA